MIQRETFYRLEKSKDLLYSEYSKHPYDRMKSVYWINDMLRRHARYVSRAYTEMGLKMTKKSEKFKWNGYCNVNIPADMVNAAEKFIKDEKSVFAAYGEMIVEGYKIAIRIDEKDKSMVATATCFDSDSPNYGFALSAYGSDWFTAVAALIFKHYEVTQENWSEYAPVNKRSFG